MKTKTIEKLNNKKAFTLAEVLITLGIIGVVASLTIPTLVKNYQKQQTVIKLKKVYTTLSQAASLAINDYGPIKNWITQEMNDTPIGSELFAKTYLIPYLKTSKNCGCSESAECVETVTRSSNGEYGYFGNTYSKFFLDDGTYIAVGIPSSTTTVIHVDLNGHKKPNKMGIDVFKFSYITIFAPDGQKQTRTNNINNLTWGCNNKGGAGNVCAAVIMQDNWQIKDDYPWG